MAELITDSHVRANKSCHPSECLYSSVYNFTLGELLSIGCDKEIDSLVLPTCKTLKKKYINLVLGCAKCVFLGLHFNFLREESFLLKGDKGKEQIEASGDTLNTKRKPKWMKPTKTPKAKLKTLKKPQNCRKPPHQR